MGVPDQARKILIKCIKKALGVATYGGSSRDIELAAERGARAILRSLTEDEKYFVVENGKAPDRVTDEKLIAAFEGQREETAAVASDVGASTPSMAVPLKHVTSRACELYLRPRMAALRAEAKKLTASKRGKNQLHDGPAKPQVAQVVAAAGGSPGALHQGGGPGDQAWSRREMETF